MSETLLNFIIVFSELGVGLLLALIGWAIYYFLGSKKEQKTTQDLIRSIKAILPKRKDKLNNHFDGDAELSENKKDANTKALMDDERKIYERVDINNQ